METINLEHYRTPGSKVFTGRDRGVDVRVKSKINEIEATLTEGTITIIIPEDIRSINPSFLEEFLFNVVKKLGKEAFYKKIIFDNKSERYRSFNNDLEEAIESILKTENSLSH